MISQIRDIEAGLERLQELLEYVNKGEANIFPDDVEMLDDFKGSLAQIREALNLPSYIEEERNRRTITAGQYVTRTTDQFVDDWIGGFWKNCHRPAPTMKDVQAWALDEAIEELNSDEVVGNFTPQVTENYDNLEEINNEIKRRRKSK
tara:strand:+ start:5548 stop:5991 length:444 start_codon:yes stop_codon:yes gene_type:complete